MPSASVPCGALELSADLPVPDEEEQDVLPSAQARRRLEDDARTWDEAGRPGVEHHLLLGPDALPLTPQRVPVSAVTLEGRAQHGQEPEDVAAPVEGRDDTQIGGSVSNLDSPASSPARPSRDELAVALLLRPSARSALPSKARRGDAVTSA